MKKHTIFLTHKPKKFLETIAHLSPSDQDLDIITNAQWPIFLELQYGHKAAIRKFVYCTYKIDSDEIRKIVLDNLIEDFKDGIKRTYILNEKLAKKLKLPKTNRTIDRHIRICIDKIELGFNKK